MYFIKHGSHVCHILEDEFEGSAPAPCGAKADKIDLIRYRDGQRQTNIVAAKPADVPLCKHCRKAEA